MTKQFSLSLSYVATTRSNGSKIFKSNLKQLFELLFHGDAVDKILADDDDN